MILKRKLFSEAGKKKLEERAKKKANKAKWLYDAAEESAEKDRAKRLLKQGRISEHEADQMIKQKGKSRLGLYNLPKNPHYNKEYSFGIDNPKFREATIDDYIAINSRDGGRIYQTKGKSKAEIEATKEWLRAHKAEFDDTVDHMFKAEKLSKKASRLKKIKKAAPWVIGGTAATAGTVAGVKAIKKKKSKKEEK